MSELTFLYGNHLLKVKKREQWWLAYLNTFDKLNPCDLKHEKGLYHLEVDKNTHYVFIVIESGS